MKNLLSIGAVAGLFVASLVGLVGCGDDPAAPTDINTHFQPKQGDTFTYARYDRDMNNQRVTSSKTIHKWVVIQAGLSHEGRNDVAKIVQLNYQADGVTSSGPNDTLYISSNANGEVFMNVIGATISRIPIAADFASQVPFTWVKVTDTKTANTMRYSAILGGSTVFNATIPGFPTPLQVIVTDTAYHKGKTGATIEGNTYGNAFHTDHTMKMLATTAGFTIINNDSLHLGFDVDVSGGILRQTMDSDSITATIPLQGARTEAVAGFEMVLISSVRK
jgi:hypothetical protein